MISPVHSHFHVLLDYFVVVDIIISPCSGLSISTYGLYFLGKPQFWATIIMHIRYLVSGEVVHYNITIGVVNMVMAGLI